MSEEKLLSDIAEVIAFVLECDASSIQFTTCAADIDTWDSLNNVKLLLELEKRFGIRFSGMEATSLENVGELVDVIEQKLSNKN